MLLSAFLSMFQIVEYLILFLCAVAKLINIFPYRRSILHTMWSGFHCCRVAGASSSALCLPKVEFGFPFFSGVAFSQIGSGQPALVQWENGCLCTFERIFRCALLSMSQGAAANRERSGFFVPFANRRPSTKPIGSLCRSGAMASGFH